MALSLACREGYLVVSLLTEIGHRARLQGFTDSSACMQMTARRGLGRMRHIALKLLWVQDQVRKEQLIVQYISSTGNPTDLMTKGFQRCRFVELCDMMGMVDLQPDGSWQPVNTILPPVSDRWHRTARDDNLLTKDLRAICMIQAVQEETEEAFPIPRCHGQMRLQVTAAGTARWRCGQCNSVVTWKAYRRSHSQVGEEYIPLRGAESSPPAGDPDVGRQVTRGAVAAPSTDVQEAQPGPAEVPPRASTWLRCSRRSQAEEHAPLQRLVEAPIQSRPTQRQVDYVAQIALRRGLDPDTVLRSLSTRAQASSWIGQHR